MRAIAQRIKQARRQLPLITSPLPPLAPLVVSGGATKMSSTLHRVERSDIDERGVIWLHVCRQTLCLVSSIKPSNPPCQMRRVDIEEVESVWIASPSSTEEGYWKRHCKVVASKTTCIMSAPDLQKGGGGSLAALQAARRKEAPVGQSWSKGLQLLLTEVRWPGG